MKRVLLTAVTAAASLLAFVGVANAAGSGGVTGPSFNVDGTLYRTVGTPTDLSNTGAPDPSFDAIYQFFGIQPYNVATAAPGDPGYNGGRWRVHGLTFANYPSAVVQSTRTEVATSTAPPRWPPRSLPELPPTSAS